MIFSIIIPSRTASNLQACVRSIRERKETCRIIVVDDGILKSEVYHGPHGGNVAMGSMGVNHAVSMFPGIKPFVFARNINLGIAQAGDDDVILLNDDTRLLTDFGFSYLAAIARMQPEYGIISAGITGAVGNAEQIAQPGTLLRKATHHTIVFVCVYIRRPVLDLVRGFAEPNKENPADSCEFRPTWLDERFEKYGWDDDDLCETVRHNLGLKLGVFDGCVVEHGVLPSTYRGPGSASASDLAPNLKRFIEKWGFRPGERPGAKEAPEPAPKW